MLETKVEPKNATENAGEIGLQFAQANVDIHEGTFSEVEDSREYDLRERIDLAGKDASRLIAVARRSGLRIGIHELIQTICYQKMMREEDYTSQGLAVFQKQKLGVLGHKYHIEFYTKPQE